MTFSEGIQMKYPKCVKQFSPLNASLIKTLTICRLLPTNCLSVFDYFLGLVLKGLKKKAYVSLERWNKSDKCIHNYSIFLFSLVSELAFTNSSSECFQKLQSIVSEELLREGHPAKSCFTQFRINFLNL